MRIALFQPDIAGNVGTILRLAACLGVAVDLIEPMGFAWSDRALARAGMDYAAQADMVRHADWAAFLATLQGRIVLLTTRAGERIDQAQFEAKDVLLFGSESAGAPGFVHDRADCRIRIPMRHGFRSLNLAVATAMTLATALNQNRNWPH